MTIDLDFGDIVEFGGALFGAFSDDKAGRENARIAQEQAARERERTVLELERARRDHRRLEGAQRVAFAAAGVRLNGSALDILADSAAENALDIKLIEAGGAIRAGFAESQAGAFRREGRDRAIGGLLGGFANLVDEF